MAPHSPTSGRVEARSRRPPLWDLLLALTLLVLLLPLSVSLIGGSGIDPTWAGAMYAAVVAMHLAFALRGRAVVVAFGVCAAAELLLALAPDLHPPGATAGSPAVLVPSSAAYLVAAYSMSFAGGVLPLVSLVVGIAGSLVVIGRAWASGTTTALVAAEPGGVLVLAGLLIASVLAAWALGRFRRLRVEQVAALAERAERADEDRQRRLREAAADERARIARELHDVIAHSVTVMVRQAEGGRYVAKADPHAAVAALAAIAETGREALTDIRTMLGVLDSEPASAELLGPQPRVEDLPQLVDRVRSTGQPVAFHVEGEPRPLDRAAHLAAYRLVQEALTNVAKHAGPRVEAEVRLVWDERSLRLLVVDRGAETSTDARLAPGGRGLVGMRERLQLVGGTLAVGPAQSGGGFEVVGEIPTASRRAVAP